MATKANTPNAPGPPSSDPPGAWPSARSGIQRILAPVEQFLAVEATSDSLDDRRSRGACLGEFSMANRYANLWHIRIGFRFGAFAFERDLHFGVIGQRWKNYQRSQSP